MGLTEYEGIARITKDAKLAAKILGRDEARYVVDTYYQVQTFRMGMASTVRAMSEGQETPEPHLFFEYLQKQMETYENQIKIGLTQYAKELPEWWWMERVVGIGPVITAGLAAHIDLDKAKAVSSIWRFGGYDPTSTWNKGEKRPWNADLKTLFWKIGESFVKVSSNERDFYGHYYAARKAEMMELNERGEFKESAANILATKNFRDDTGAKAALLAGKLPQAQIHARAKRLAVKLFLSHWYEVVYKEKHGQWPAKPWIIVHGGHVDYIPVPYLNDEFPGVPLK